MTAQMNTPQQAPQDAERVRFIAELEFVQCLANPNYFCFLAQHGYFKKPEFINYMEYLKVASFLSKAQLSWILVLEKARICQTHSLSDLPPVSRASPR